jgi:hypothetical protein
MISEQKAEQNDQAWHHSIQHIFFVIARDDFVTFAFLAETKKNVARVFSHTV